MAHNIIMPALGMAQETGTILAWRKQLGDPVKASDVIMEIETDKTTVEIEAGHDGFLTSILAETGIPVPVGEVVAIVSADASDIGAAPAGKKAKPAPKEAARPAAQPPAPSSRGGSEMAHNIIMPALGMAQETGTILAWHKQLGDPVKASDVIMEIETDKTTVEIEAGHDGFLTSILAETGVPVPVGEVVAIVSADASDTGVAPAGKKAKPASKEAARPAAQPPRKSEEKPAEKPPEATTPALQADKAPARPAPTPSGAADGRVLASPKARRLAAERGIDLHRLVQLGAVQPLHVSDIDRAPLSGDTTFATHSILRARIERAAFDSFIAWIREEAEIPLDALNVWAAFAAAAYRKAAASGDEAEIVIQASRLGEDLETVALRNPDQVGLSAIRAGETSVLPAVALLDLTGSALVEYRPAPPATLQFTIADGMRDETFDLALAFDPAVFPLRDALIFLKDLTARTEQPLRHLI